MDAQPNGCRFDITYEEKGQWEHKDKEMRRWSEGGGQKEQPISQKASSSTSCIEFRGRLMIFPFSPPPSPCRYARTRDMAARHTPHLLPQPRRPGWKALTVDSGTSMRWVPLIMSLGLDSGIHGTGHATPTLKVLGLILALTVSIIAEILVRILVDRPPVCTDPGRL